MGSNPSSTPAILQSPPTGESSKLSAMIGRLGSVTGVSNVSLARVGAAAPSFSLPDQHGELRRLADLIGSWVVLWWYPRAATPG
jgi:peroxiredoxin Q/BCP